MGSVAGGGIVLVAQSSQPTAAPAAVEVRADCNQDGADDLAIGAPLERVGGLFAAGAAHVLYGCRPVG
jgi:hypothetical protein